MLLWEIAVLEEGAVFVGLVGQVCLIDLVSIDLIGLVVGFVGVGFVGFVGFAEVVGFVGLVGFAGFVDPVEIVTGLHVSPHNSRLFWENVVGAECCFYIKFAGCAW